MSSIYDNYPAVRYVDEYEKDRSEECKRCVDDCGFIGMTGEWACKGFRPKAKAKRVVCPSSDPCPMDGFDEGCSFMGTDKCPFSA